jgi:hypothetical protein
MNDYTGRDDREVKDILLIIEVYLEKVVSILAKMAEKNTIAPRGNTVAKIELCEPVLCKSCGNVAWRCNCPVIIR